MTIKETSAENIAELLLGSPYPSVFFVTGQVEPSGKRHVRILVDDMPTFAHEYFVNGVVNSMDKESQGKNLDPVNIKVTLSNMSLDDISSFVRGHRKAIELFNSESKDHDDYDELTEASNCALFLADNHEDICAFVDQLPDHLDRWSYAGFEYFKARGSKKAFDLAYSDKKLAERLRLAARKAATPP